VMNWAERLDAIPEFCVGHKVYFPRHQCALLKFFRLQYRGTKNARSFRRFSNTLAATRLCSESPICRRHIPVIVRVEYR
jgi:hypothetical protein